MKTVPRARGPKVWVIVHHPQLKQSNTCSFEKKRKERKKTRRRDTRVGQQLIAYWTGILTSLYSSGSCRKTLNRNTDEFRLVWEWWKCECVRSSVCVLLCFIKPILGNRYGPGVNSLREARGNPLFFWPLCGIQEFRNSRNSGIQDFRNSGIQEFTGIQEFRIPTHTSKKQGKHVLFFLAALKKIVLVKKKVTGAEHDRWSWLRVGARSQQ